jgi:tRNA nucleotidyltransferase (CCA-adding enzyme)
VCTADSRGRPSYEDNAYTQANFFKLLLEKSSEVDVKDIVAAGFKGMAIREQLHQKRMMVVKAVRKEWFDSAQDS